MNTYIPVFADRSCGLILVWVTAQRYGSIDYKSIDLSHLVIKLFMISSIQTYECFHIIESYAALHKLGILAFFNIELLNKNSNLLIGMFVSNTSVNKIITDPWNTPLGMESQVIFNSKSKQVQKPQVSINKIFRRYLKS